MGVPKHGGSVKTTIRHTRSRHEQRLAEIRERRLNEERQREIALEAIAALEAKEEADEDAGYRNNRGEAQVVIGAQLGAIVREWSANWLKSRNPDHEHERGKLYGGGSMVMGPIDWLSEKTGVNLRRISGISNDEFRTVAFSQAEAILRAIDRDYMLSNGEIHVIPNPTWTFEKWVEHMKQAGCI